MCVPLLPPEQQHHLTWVACSAIVFGPPAGGRPAAKSTLWRCVTRCSRWACQHAGRSGAGFGRGRHSWSGGLWAGKFLTPELSLSFGRCLQPRGALQLIGSQHYGGAYPRNTFRSRSMPIPASQTATFHVFALEWEQKQVIGCLSLHWLLGCHTALCTFCGLPLPFCLPARPPACPSVRPSAELPSSAAGSAAPGATPLLAISGSVFPLSAVPYVDALVPGWNPVLFNEQRQRQPHKRLV